MQKSKYAILLAAGRLVLLSLRWSVFVFVYGLLLYAVFALISATIPVHSEEIASSEQRSIKMYLLKSGPHTDFLVQTKTSVHDWTIDFPFSNNENPDTALSWLAIGWGDKGFYLNTPTWGDLTCKTAVSAAAGLGTAGIHASYYYAVPDDRPLVQLELTNGQYRRLCEYIRHTLVADEHGNRIMLHPERPGINFGHDRYYDAYGTYSMIHTCNTWINNGLKASGQRACLWTGFAEGIFYQYDK
ncbi:MAG: DUF2459 domain-containing protein [Flavobacteriales bacterium]